MPIAGRTFDLSELLTAALQFPPVTLVIALVIAGGILFSVSKPESASRLAVDRTSPGAGRYAAEHRTLGAVALLVVIVFMAEFVVRGYLIVDPSTIWWWRFAVPIASAALGLGVVLSVIATRGSTPPEVPVALATRRSWTSFSTNRMLLATAVVALAVTVTTVLAGLGSTPNDQGQYVWLAIPIPNEPTIDPIRVLFYGWTFGVPVLVCVTALLALLWAALDRNSARPFLRPETVATERAARRMTASGAARIAAGAMLLTLASAWKLIASAGSGSELTIIGSDQDVAFEASWRYSELAIAAGWCAPLLEITAFVLLISTVTLGIRREQRTAPEDVAVPISEGISR